MKKYITIYGFGLVGEHVANQLLSCGFEIPLIIDKHKAGQFYRGIPIVSLGAAADIGILDQSDCLIALHNHYVDLDELRKVLIIAGVRQVYSIVSFHRQVHPISVPRGYWLEEGFEVDQHRREIESFLSLLYDETSRNLVTDVIRYRTFGNITECPKPSPKDEYTPVDLPGYRGPLRVLDCGAFTGVALRKFRKAGYEIQSFAAFEPDLLNFETLVKEDFGAAEGIYFPVATWSSNVHKRFNSNRAMASSISDEGEALVPCVRVDDTLLGFAPNLIKLDVEGAEFETLIGMEETIRKYRPNLCISAYHTAHDIFRLGLLVASWDLGYKFHVRLHEQNTFGLVVYGRQQALEV